MNAKVRGAGRSLNLPKALIAELIGSIKQGRSSFVAIPTDRSGRKRKTPETRIKLPRLPLRGSLTKAQEWKSLRWIIDTAEAHGAGALRGLTIALARMIQADAFAALFFDARPHRSSFGNVDQLLWDRNRPITRDGKLLSDLLIPRRTRDRIELNATAVITNVWEPWRLARALQHLGPSCTWGPWKQEENHHAIAWHPWPLVWIDNGNHSATTAMLKGGGVLKCEASFDAAPLLRVIATDGRQWFGENRRLLGPVRSLPMAGILEIGRRLIQLKDNRRGPS